MLEGQTVDMSGEERLVFLTMLRKDKKMKSQGP